MIELLDFWAGWCYPCKMMEPVLEELEKEFSNKVKFKKIDVDVDKEARIASQYNVRSIPTLVILKEGKETDRLVGISSKELIKAKLQSLSG